MSQGKDALHEADNDEVGVVVVSLLFVLCGWAKAPCAADGVHIRGRDDKLRNEAHPGQVGVSIFGHS